MNAAVLAVLAWLAAASVTRAVTADGFFAPLRVVHHARVQQRAQMLLTNLRSMPPDHPRRWAVARRYEWLVAWSEFFTCPWCVGFWVYAAASVAAWAALGFPAVLWGGAAWFSVPAAALAGRWIYGMLAKWLDPVQPTTPVTLLPN